MAVGEALGVLNLIDIKSHYQIAYGTTGPSRAVSFPKRRKITSVEGVKVMGANLIEQLRQVKDFRTKDLQFRSRNDLIELSNTFSNYDNSIFSIGKYYES
ncbi:hypothetical protein QUB05_31770 [Microcoleus sp. F10-C6]